MKIFILALSSLLFIMPAQAEDQAQITLNKNFQQLAAAGKLINWINLEGKKAIYCRYQLTKPPTTMNIDGDLPFVGNKVHRNITSSTPIWCHAPYASAQTFWYHIN